MWSTHRWSLLLRWDLVFDGERGRVVRKNYQPRADAIPYRLAVSVLIIMCLEKYLLGASVVVYVLRDTILFLLSLSEHIEAYLVVSRALEERNKSTCFVSDARWQKR